MIDAYVHLHASIRSAADDSAEMRIRRIRTDRWVSYVRAESALCAMEELLSFPKRTRMPNLLLIGPTNNGKTMIVESCCEDSNVEFPRGAASEAAKSLTLRDINIYDSCTVFSGDIANMGLVEHASHLVSRDRRAVRELRVLR